MKIHGKGASLRVSACALAIASLLQVEVALAHTTELEATQEMDAASEPSSSRVENQVQTQAEFPGESDEPTASTDGPNE